MNAVLGARLGLGKSGIGMAAAELVEEILKVGRRWSSYGKVDGRYITAVHIYPYF